MGVFCFTEKKYKERHQMCKDIEFIAFPYMLITSHTGRVAGGFQGVSGTQLGSNKVHTLRLGLREEI